jgi:hypothetical protein
MLASHYQFQYNLENIYAYSYVFSMDNMLVPLIILWTIAIYGCIYFIAPHISSFLKYRRTRQEKDSKQTIVKNLILMKEAQGELEKEIEQSLLNIALHDKTK